MLDAGYVQVPSCEAYRALEMKITDSIGCIVNNILTRGSSSFHPFDIIPHTNVTLHRLIVRKYNP